MLEDLTLGQTLSKDDFRELEAELRPELIRLQREAREAGIPVVVVIGGVDAAGRTRLVSSMAEWLDPRRIDVHALEDLAEERRHPYAWRFWNRLPPAGRMAIFLGSWYTPPIVQRVYRVHSKKRFRRELDRIRRFEELLVQEGVLLQKIWLQISKDEMESRLTRLAAKKRTRFRVSQRDWNHLELYDPFREVSSRALEATSTELAPWKIVDATCRRHRTIEAFRCLKEGLEAGLERAVARASEAKPRAQRVPAEVPMDTVVDRLDLGLSLDREAYEERKQELSLRLNRLAREVYERRLSAAFVFEGCDAAGKGGAIRRVVRAMHPKIYRVHPTAAPSQEERRYPYLWRFWRALARDGKLTFFDRSWYGRVLVERVEGFCRPEDWERAYAEIREFERQLLDHGMAVVKFWLQISQDEQLRRFEDRAQTPHKRWKITPEDWRNREKWPATKKAVEEMISRTDHPDSPWVLIEAEDKLHARIRVMEVVAETLERLLDGEIETKEHRFDPEKAPPQELKLQGSKLPKDKARREGRKKRRKKDR